MTHSDPGVNLLSLALDDGPTVAELQAIEDEWPLIATELALVDAEVLAATHPSTIADTAVVAARRLVAVVGESYRSHDLQEVS